MLQPEHGYNAVDFLLRARVRWRQIGQVRGRKRDLHGVTLGRRHGVEDGLYFRCLHVKSHLTLHTATSTGVCPAGWGMAP